LALRVGQHGDPFGRGAEQDPLAGETRTDPQGDRDVSLAGPGRVAVELLMLWSSCRSGCG
jgi:hypothetical protein